MIIIKPYLQLRGAEEAVRQFISQAFQLTKRALSTPSKEFLWVRAIGPHLACITIGGNLWWQLYSMFLFGNHKIAHVEQIFNVWVERNQV